MAELFKKYLILAFAFNLLCMPVLALELDTSVDDEIRKNYNPSRIENDVELPSLPKILNEKPISIQKTVAPQKQVVQSTQGVPQSAHIPSPTLYTQTATNRPSQGNCITLRQGTLFRVKSATSISDRSPKGAKISFISRYPVCTTYLTIPSGTEFRGVVVDSHKPQLTGNGGLIVIRITSVILNGEVQPITASITEAHFKKVFFNNIKGKRKYISSMFKSMKPGSHFFKKMLSVSGNLAQDGSSIVVAPFSLIIGALAVAGNVMISPALALFYKGDYLYIKEGSDFEIKLLQNAYIYR